MKQSLVITLGKVDEPQSQKYNIDVGAALIEHDFVLATDKETADLRDKNSLKAFENLGLKARIGVGGLPVPDVD